MSGKAFLRKRGAMLALLIFGVSLGAARAQQETLLYNFCAKRGCPDGAGPAARLVLDQRGNLYGTTTSGGNPKTCNGYGCGVVFRLTPAGKESIYSFCSQPRCADGAEPAAGVVFDRNGNLYGTTYAGGAYGFGTVFRINTEGKETVLYSFCAEHECLDGEGPSAGVVLDGEGNIYGTTSAGGAFLDGTVFKLTPEGKETILHSFCGDLCGGADGIEPAAGLVFDQKGNLYGTTVLGGSGSGLLGNGTVFKVTPEGNETVLYSFCSLANCPDGSAPYSSLVLDRSGNLYGTTSAGGIGGQFGSGVVFKLTPEGTEAVLYSFCALTNCTDGAYPLAGLVFGPSGNLYGTAESGGATGIGGVVFEVTAQGKEELLHSFGVQNNDGAAPQAGLVIDREGNLFGTTSAGGANHGGVVFKLAP